MSTLRLLISMLAGSAALVAWSSAVPAPAPLDDACADKQVPITWPLGATGFEPQLLYNSHGQFLKLSDTVAAYVHRGIDIAACVGDVVFAAEAGTVVYEQYTWGDDQNLVVIADSDGTGVGWKYQHLADLYVKKGDTVLRDQAIGTVARFGGWAGFDHVHFQRVSDTSSGAWTSWTDGGNPLLPLAATSDPSEPEVFEMDTTGGMEFFKVYDVGTDTERAPTDMLGAPVDVACNLSDLFEGSGAPICSYRLCGTDISNTVMPMKVSFSVFRVESIPDGADGERTVVEEVFTNVIDLGASISAPSDFAKIMYRTDDSVGTYSERQFVVNVNRCPTTGDGTLELTSTGNYILQVVAQDTAGNVDVRNLSFELSP